MLPPSLSPPLPSPCVVVRGRGCGLGLGCRVPVGEVGGWVGWVSLLLSSLSPPLPSPCGNRWAGGWMGG